MSHIHLLFHQQILVLLERRRLLLSLVVLATPLFHRLHLYQVNPKNDTN